MDQFQEPNVQLKTRKSADILKAELERKSKDLYKVYNPTNQPFQVILNAKISPEVWTVEAKGEAVVPAYVKEKYFEEMTQRIITAKSDKAIIDENEKRESKGLEKLSLHKDQPRIEQRMLKTLFSKKDQIIKVLDRGLYKEYGLGAGTPKQGISREDVQKLDISEVFEPKPMPAKPPIAPQPTITPQPVQTPVNTPVIPETKPTIIEEPTKIIEEADEPEA